MTNKDEPLERRLMSMWRNAATQDRAVDGEIGLAEALGVGRPALREAIAKLEATGIVYRRQGAVTILNQDALQLAGRFDEQGEFTDIIHAAGATPSVDLIESQIVELGESDISVFGTEAGSTALCVTKRWKADTIPARLAIDTMPITSDIDIASIDTADSILELAWRLTGESVAWDLAFPTAVTATAELADRLRVGLGDPLLLLETIGISSMGRRLYRSLDYHVPGIVPQALIRTVR